MIIIIVVVIIVIIVNRTQHFWHFHFAAGLGFLSHSIIFIEFLFDWCLLCHINLCELPLTSCLLFFFFDSVAFTICHIHHTWNLILLRLIWFDNFLISQSRLTWNIKFLFGNFFFVPFYYFLKMTNVRWLFLQFWLIDCGIFKFSHQMF